MFWESGVAEEGVSSRPVGQKLWSDPLLLPVSDSSSSEQWCRSLPGLYLCTWNEGSPLSFSHMSSSSRLFPSLWGLSQGRSPREETPPHGAPPSLVGLSLGQALSPLGNGVTPGQSQEASCFPVPYFLGSLPASDTLGFEASFLQSKGLNGISADRAGRPH